MSFVPQLPTDLEGISAPFRNLMNQCFQSNPADRPDFKDIVTILNSISAVGSGGGLTRTSERR